MPLEKLRREQKHQVQVKIGASHQTLREIHVEQCEVDAKIKRVETELSTEESFTQATTDKKQSLINQNAEK